MIQLPDWGGMWGQVGQVLGTLGLGAVLLRVVDGYFKRIDRGDAVAAGLRAEMVHRLATLEAALDTSEQSEHEHYRERMRLEAENRHIRQRFSALVNWITTVTKRKPPEWVYEVVDGPTADEPSRPWQTRPRAPGGTTP